MASLFTSCPTFLLSQLPSSFLGKEDTFYPRCIAIWPLCDLVHHDANVWPWAGSHIGHSGPMRIVRLAPRQGAVTWLDPRRLPNICKKKKKNLLQIVQSLNLWRCPTFHDSSHFTGQKALWHSRCVRPTLKRHFFLLTILLCFATTLGGSYCLQVSGSAGRWSRVRNELTLGST